MRLWYAVSFFVISLSLFIGAYFYPQVHYAWFLFGPLFIIGWRDYFQKRKAIKRNYPILGNFRYLFEMIRPEINQYFVENNTDGRPFSRDMRSLVYQRAKKTLDTLPFGTQKDVYQEGYEFLMHSMMPTHVEWQNLRTTIGGKDCKQPYSCSLYNISAMSFGSLSPNAVLALNGGACEGGFAHNTGEGGISPYHKEPGGDLIWQIGTGYFGCRTHDGKFNPEMFAQNATLPQVKMIEIKVSQGAKPGHGGILPKEKINEEIAEIRGVPMGKDVISPPGHSAFSTPEGMMTFIKQLRDLSGGKPIGFKICLGQSHELFALCKAMQETGISPDFIVVDGGEGGTGAAPVEFSNRLGTPSYDALIYLDNVLRGFDLRDQIKIMATGKITSSFHMIKLLALGADVCYAARSFMLSLGCIQALSCNTNHCPAGVATQDPQLTAGLVVSDKRIRVKNYHNETMKSLAHMLGAMGLESAEQLSPYHIKKRMNHFDIRSYAEYIPKLEPGAFLKGEIPDKYKRAFSKSSSKSFKEAA